MEESKDVIHLKRIATEAVEMLEDMKHRFGLFEGQRFGKLKGKLSDYNRLSKQLSSGLSYIETSDDPNQ